ncbi:YgaP family membrane protein [Carboxylicivirga litoralis]|uniref:YgaP family membrane protein n=1 Tax=Carboxylicivirga litoralis TaxID=2816963 RepID=UPI003967ABF9
MLMLLMLKKELYNNQNNITMQERIVRAVAGTFVLISILLAVYVNINWLFLAGFVGVNLIQSSITKWCLMTDILTKLGVPK